jgi:hypothetical protein
MALLYRGIGFLVPRFFNSALGQRLGWARSVRRPWSTLPVRREFVPVESDSNMVSEEQFDLPRHHCAEDRFDGFRLADGASIIVSARDVSSSCIEQRAVVTGVVASNADTMGSLGATKSDQVLDRST